MKILSKPTYINNKILFNYLKYIKIFKERSDNMNQKNTNNQKTFFRSFINNRVLFERRKNSIWIPLLILLVVILSLALPPIVSSSSITGETLINKFPQIEEPMSEIFTSSLNCSVKDAVLVCDEESSTFNKVIGDDIKYTVIVNQDAVAIDVSVEYTKKKDTDNLIMLFANSVHLRYTERDHINEQATVYEIIGDYSNLEGFSFKEISEKIANNPESLSKEMENFVLNISRSRLHSEVLASISVSLTSFLLLVAVTCIILKGSYLFKRKKGLKFSECFKISMTSILPCIVVSILVSSLYGFNGEIFATCLGFVYVVRILFIYFKYILNNKIIQELYEETKEERFKI